MRKRGITNLKNGLLISHLLHSISMFQRTYLILRMEMNWFLKAKHFMYIWLIEPINLSYWAKTQRNRGVLQDLFKSLIALFTIPEDQFEAKKENFFNQEVLWIAEKLSKVLENRQWAVGDNLTYIDFQLFEAEEILRNYNPEAFTTPVGLKKHNENFVNLPAIKKYQSSDKMIARPFYPPGMYRWG
ncbi:unnamed protein product (macronuclear) [Paramecium tetraurelia]|uniref:GST C-terminal domain-containing protein n=1 Tax=Paramecium tetraurelia TaxID=5888 RepID=A0E7A3_PARTE|nr:uncharacterized protein GSPATT00023898001 [Paramecium tetraurelia]CAK91170.1 unnamed protein product [Paramecium tetraurelia]|eukprot:XP_001458567.1 hypothetical protein (macronuclear) [Paramecium tetraurelia strain d4-2]